MASIAHLTVEIKGTSYGVETFFAEGTGNKVVRLSKLDGTAYDVEQGWERTTCNCPDYQRRHAELPYSDGCKHVRSMVELGLIENIKPWEVTEVPAECGVSGAWFEAGSVDAAQVEHAAKPEPVVMAKPVKVDDSARRQANLVQKYRPTTLADVVGQDEAVYQLREFAEAPSETAFLFDGDTGVGKTSAALALAHDLGCDVEREELGGVYTIAAGNQLADDVRETLRSLSLRPLFGSGWKVLIVNECDRMSEAVAYLWLDALENLPMRAVVVFTTNRVEKLPRRFVTRCERFTFKADVESVGLAAQARVNEVWRAETGRNDAPNVAEIDGAIENGQVSIRACMQGLNGLVRKAKATQARHEPTNEADNKPTAGEARVKTGRKPIADGIDWDSYGRRYEAGESRSALARELGIKETRFWNRVSKLGYKSPKKFYHAPKAKVNV